MCSLKTLLSRLVTCLLCALALGGPAPAAGAQGRPERAYVTASRASVRAQPAPAAPIIGYLTTNADVQILERTRDWCGVRAASFTGSGYIACRLLGDAPLTVPDIEARLRAPALSPGDRVDWQSRAFWVAPSVSRLEAVGYAMEDVFLTAPIQEREANEGKALRPRHADFDAMKARLEAGVIGAPSRPSPLPMEDEDGPLRRAMKRAALPPIRPSYFAGDEPLFGIPLLPFTLHDSGAIGAGLADALSAVNAVSFQARVAGAVYMAHSGSVGVWDVATMAVTFDREVTVYGITGSGAPTGLRIASLVTPLGRQPCTGRTLDLKARPLNGRWSSAIVGWAGKPGPQGSAAVTNRQVGGGGKYDKLVIETIDLDRDGVPDLSLWAGVEPPIVDADRFWKAVFGNVGGTWVLLAFNQEADCT
jgi:hypothetical protein